MKDFVEKYKKDQKYKTKIKLLLYSVFVLIVSIYALSLPSAKNISDTDNNIENNNINDQTNNKSIIKIPEKYTYKIDITIDEIGYKYHGEKNISQKTIIKETVDNKKEYIYQDNEYYINDNGLYIKTTKDEVYDIINYNYINIENINTYLNKAEKTGNQYLVYLKDIILGNDSEKYFVIVVNENKINIDYTPLMQEFNSNIEKYKVDIEIKEKE